MNTIRSEKKLFYSLARILNRLSLTEDELPKNISQWQDFISHINNSFYDFEQERYLIERSMEISSRELIELNEQFELAESMAHIGHWTYDSAQDKAVWSKETYRIFGIDHSAPTPNYKTFLTYMLEEDRAKLMRLVERALLSGESYEASYRVYNQINKEIVWVETRGIAMPIESNSEFNRSYSYNLMGTVIDVTKRKKAEQELREMNERLITLSRQVGMSEIATAVLHNIGNILNSANISTFMIKETLDNSELKSFSEIIKMMQENLTQDPAYLFSDEKGKLIPSYLKCFSESLTLEHKQLKDEASSLINHLDHIKNILVVQNDIAGVSGLTESVRLSELVEHAIQLSYHVDSSRDIQLEKRYLVDAVVQSDKTKLMQILVNLIRNAKESLRLSNEKNDKKLTIFIQPSEKKGSYEILVADNGVGILEENMKKIFSMGYTTKREGHGFGLHSSIIAIRELGGVLSVKSDGLGKGAVFTLTIPEGQCHESC